jgi:hypothetical protein
MPTQLAHNFREELNLLCSALHALSPQVANVPWRIGGWTSKQIVGHMLDSAANNRQRFVRAAIDGHYAGPTYAQDAWVEAHGYAGQSWVTLLHWWEVEHEILTAVVDRIPEECLETSCVIGTDPPVSLRFLIEDYVRHQKWHLSQLTSGIPVS